MFALHRDQKSSLGCISYFNILQVNVFIGKKFNSGDSLIVLSSFFSQNRKNQHSLV